LGVITDVHLSLREGESERWHGPYDFSRALARLEWALGVFHRQRVDFIVVCGDVSHRGDVASLTRATELLERAHAPLLIVPGNHDCEESASALGSLLAVRRASNVRLASSEGLVVAPSIRLAGRGSQPVKGSPLASADDTGAWGDDLVVWVSHFPVVSLRAVCEGARLLYAGDASDVDAATMQLTRRTSPTIALVGHLHIRDAALRGTLLQLAGAALIEAPGDVAIIDIARDPATCVRRRVCETNIQHGQRVPVLAPVDETFQFTPSGGWTRSAESLLLSSRHRGP
jgi:hypothetical protein